MLPNHYLFSLAERTPADMAALLSVFHPVPPVIRRRAKELLDAIRDTVKGALGPTAETPRATAGPSAAQEVAMPIDEEASAAEMPKASTLSSALWANGECPCICVIRPGGGLGGEYRSHDGQRPSTLR